MPQEPEQNLIRISDQQAEDAYTHARRWNLDVTLPQGQPTRLRHGGTVEEVVKQVLEVERRIEYWRMDRLRLYSGSEGLIRMTEQQSKEKKAFLTSYMEKLTELVPEISEVWTDGRRQHDQWLRELHAYWKQREIDAGERGR